MRPIAILVLLAALAGAYVPAQGRETGASASKIALPDPEWTVRGDDKDANKPGAALMPSLPAGTATQGVHAGAAGGKSAFTLWCGKRDVKCPAGRAEKYAEALQTANEYLQAEYGPPLFTGHVNVLVLPDPKINGLMVWRSTNESSRQVLLNEFNFIESEWRVIVHELFHALYQTNAFLKSYPDFVAEGLASYAEYRYRYRDREPAAIAAIMQEHLKGLGYPANAAMLDLNLPFSAQGVPATDALYVLSAFYFMSQEPRHLQTALKRILGTSAVRPEKSWTSLSAFSGKHGFSMPGSISRDLAAKELTTPQEERVAVTGWVASGITSGVASGVPAAANGAGTAAAASDGTKDGAKPSKLDLCSVLPAGDSIVSDFIRAVVDERKYRAWRLKHCPTATTKPPAKSPTNSTTKSPSKPN